MSGQCTGWVLRHGPRPIDLDREGKAYGTARARGLRAVLTTVADAANRDGEHAHPGLAAVIEGSLYSRRQALRLLTDLESEGWLTTTEPGGGRGVATVYRVNMDRRRNGAMAPTSLERNGAISGRETVPFEQPAPLFPNVSTQRAVVGTEVPDPFDAFWSEYPRKVEKQTARKRWQAQVKRGADPRDLVTAGANYARAKRDTPTDKIKHAATFLSADDVWRDWLDGGAALAEAEQGEVYVTDEPIYS